MFRDSVVRIAIWLDDKSFVHGENAKDSNHTSNDFIMSILAHAKRQ